MDYTRHPNTSPTNSHTGEIRAQVCADVLKDFLSLEVDRQVKNKLGRAYE